MADTLPPPPPYEANQREFDQKTSQAIEASLSVVDGRDRASGSADADEWEYDEAAFEAAFQAALRLKQPDEATSSADTAHKSDGYEKSARPLSPQIDRKSPGPGAKERPSWYSEANLDGASYTSSSSSTRPLGATHPPPSHYEAPPHDEAPPPFQAQQSSYRGGESTPPSPLSSPPLANAPLQQLHTADTRGRASSSQPHPHSFSPPPQRQAHRMGPRIANASTSPAPRRLSFDPSVAYSNRSRNSASPRLEAGNTNPAAFYNSAVSSQLASPYAKQTNSRASQVYSRPTQFQTPPPIPQPANFNFHHSPTAAQTSAPPFAPFNGYSPHQMPQMATPSVQTASYNPYTTQTHPTQGYAAQSYPSQGYAPSGYAPQAYAAPAFSGQSQRWATSEDQLGREFL